MLGKLNGLMVVVGIALLTLPVSAQQSRPIGPDQELVGKLHLLGQQEIAMAKLGQARAVRTQVKTFADEMQRDHRAMDNGLLVYAQRKNMNPDVIAYPGDATAYGAQAMAPLVASTRGEFDYRFASQMVADHQAVIDAATAAQRLARDPELKAVIGTNLAMLSEHLVSAQLLLAGIPEPPPPVVSLPGEPGGVSRTQTGADEPPPGAWQPITP